jgi:hypothetical protein
MDLVKITIQNGEKTELIVSHERTKLRQYEASLLGNPFLETQ